MADRHHLMITNTTRLPSSAYAPRTGVSARPITSNTGGQHRGRLFLPFADNDPKTAEIVSKVLLLAKDREIMDPKILDQIGIAANHTGTPVATTARGKSKSKPKKGAKSIRRFELSDDKSSKFWEVKVEGDSVVTKWGKIGSEGRTTTKTFASESKAKEAMKKLVSDKVGKGYTEA